MAFAGYLLKSGNDAFPNKYIELGSYDVTPDQREEIKAERDDNTRKLIRVTASGMKSVIHFKTRPNLTLSEVSEITSWFRNHEAGETGETTALANQQRKIPITFWNPDPADKNYPDYDSGYFYRPNMKFPIKRIDGNNIIYDSLEFDLIEY